MNPSNFISAHLNPGKHMFHTFCTPSRPTKDDLAKADKLVKQELEEAGIKVIGTPSTRQKGEVATIYLGELCQWGFRRAWYYWIATGPGIPPEIAEEFHKDWGTQVRVGGDCDCPSPLEYNKGFAICLYHIDTHEGLKAFADLLKTIYREPGKVAS